MDLRRLAPPRHRPTLLLLSVAVPLVVSALLSLVRAQLSPAGAVLVLVLVVVAAAAAGDRVAGLLAACSGGVFFDLFLTQPYGTLAIDDPDDVEAFLLLVLVGVAVTELALWGRRQQAAASRTVGYLDGALTAAEVLAGQEGAVTPGATARVVGLELTRLLDLDDCRWVPDVRADRRTVVQPDGTVLRDGRPLDVARRGLPTDDETALPVRVGGRVTGTLLLVTATRVRRPGPAELRVAVLLADQLGRASDAHVYTRTHGPSPRP